MTTLFDDDIIIHYIAAPGLDGDGLTKPEALALRNDIDDLLSRPVIARLADIPDVSGTPANGDSIVFNEPANEWEVGLPDPTMWIERWLNPTTFEDVNKSAKRLSFFRGLSAQQQSGFAERVIVSVQYGGTGTSDSVARSDHLHSLRRDVSFPFNETGTLSSGTRTLISGTITGLFTDREYIITATLRGDLRGGGTGAGYTLPRITLGAITHDRFNGTRGEVRTVSGVDREFSMAHPSISSAGNSSVTVSAAISYRSGDPIIVGAGELMVHIKVSR